MTELLSPAGNYEKLKTAWRYGADAAYMGLDYFSLRKNADNFTLQDLERVKALKEKEGKKLYCTLNILFHEHQINELKTRLSEIEKWPFDAFIVSDVGAGMILKEHFGTSRELHLSTQASCLNSTSAKLYHRMGFDRVILGRETSLDEIRRIKDADPDLQLESFVHGAMCMAYSGRCMLSSHMAGRSSNQGDCAQPCRWNWRVEEQKRPGEYFPVEEHDGFTTIFSSKDLCMIDHLDELRDAGIDSFKIEGRMKSLYYVAAVTRAYRSAMDHTDDNAREEIFNVSHREFTTGFYFGEGKTGAITKAGYQRPYLFLGRVKEEIKPGIWSLDLRNQIKTGQKLEFLSPDRPSYNVENYTLLNEQLELIDQIDHGKIEYLRTEAHLQPGDIIRRLQVNK